MAKRVHHEDAVEDEALNTLRDQVSSLSMTVASLVARIQDSKTQPRYGISITLTDITSTSVIIRSSWT
jgi:hypothetical protein